ncbi:MAG: hypothetical protein DHS20C13_14720 [Thermodesulfobacteriota bacterium]|nr:MAG: hypothetical protein DHS20C13_14720 [Thermodesulfobacteriota bacterium]
MCLVDKDRLKKLYESDPPEYSEAVAIQNELRDKVISKNGFDSIKTVAGVDLAILKDKKNLYAE